MSAFRSFSFQKLMWAMLAVVFMASTSSLHAVAQEMSMPAPQPVAGAQADQSQAVQDQITRLKEQVARLQGALRQRKATTSVTGTKAVGGDTPAAMGMEGDSAEMAAASPQPLQEDSGEMGGMAAPKSRPAGMQPPPMGPMEGEKPGMDAMAGAKGMKKPMPMGESGCCGMGSMGKPMKGGMGTAPMGMGPMAAKSAKMSTGAMPGAAGPAMASGAQPAAMSLLHVGAKDFFLDHAQHLALTSVQKASLESIKAKTEQQDSASQTQIAQAQQDLWQLTSAAQPNGGDIDGKVQQIAKLRADEQIYFVHAVYAASTVLTAQQQQEVLMPMTPARKGRKAAMPAAKPMKM